MLMPQATLADIDFSEKYRIDQANYLLNKLKFTATNEGISPVNISAFKI